MPRKHAADKALRQSRRQNARNRAEKDMMKKTRKSVLASVLLGALDAATARKAISTIGRAAAHGVIHRNKAARLISRLQKKINAARK